MSDLQRSKPTSYRASGPDMATSGEARKYASPATGALVVLCVVGALAAGVAAGVMLPRRPGMRIPRGVRTGLALAGEFGLTLALSTLNRDDPADTQASPAHSTSRELAATPSGSRLTWLDTALSLLKSAKRKPDNG